MKRRSIKVGDLPDLAHHIPGLSLYCESCDGFYSACRGDYWQLPKDHVMTCCGEPMRLARKVTRLVDVNPTWNRKEKHPS